MAKSQTQQRPDGATASTPTPPQYPIESVDNALKLLLLFAERPRVRLTDAATYLGVASSTAHRLLAMLQWRGFVVQEAVTKAYVPGAALNMIASAITRQTDTRARSRPILERLSARFDETISLSRLQGTMIHFIDSIEGSKAVRVGQRSGVIMPAHWTSSGKATLSQLSDETVTLMYPDEQLETMTEKTIATRTNLLRDLAVIRRRGWAATVGESEDGVAGVAVALPAVGDAIYALSVALPAHRMNPTLRTEIVRALADATAELGTLLLA